MRRHRKQLKQEAASLQLSAGEKKAGRDRLVALMELQPVRIAGAPRQRDAARARTILFFNRKHMLAKGVIMAALALTGGTSAAAEGAVPGDTLYPIKTKFNEEVRAAVARSNQAKAEWDGRRAERRLEEAVTLAVEGELSDEQLTRIQTGFAAHAEHMEQRAAALEANGNAEAAAEIRSRLQAAVSFHESFFASLAEGGDAAAEAGAKLQAHLEVVRAEHEQMEQERREKFAEKLQENPERAEQFLSNRVDGIERHITQTERMVEKLGENLSEEDRAQIEASIDTAADVHAKAQAAVEAGNIAEALSILEEAGKTLHQDAHLLKKEIRTELKEHPEAAARLRANLEERFGERHPGANPPRGPEDNRRQERPGVEFRGEFEGNVEGDTGVRPERPRPPIRVNAGAGVSTAIETDLAL